MPCVAVGTRSNLPAYHLPRKKDLKRYTMHLGFLGFGDLALPVTQGHLAV